MNNNSPTTAQPIFILSCPRSGSTLLRYILDTHPDICSPGELHLGRLCKSLKQMLTHLCIEQFKLHSKKTEERINSEIRRFVSEKMSDYATSKGKQVWCEKTPANLDYLGDLSNVFKEAKYICLHRHCMDVVHSCLSVNAGINEGVNGDFVYYARNRNKISTLVDGWINNTRKLLEFERENPSKCFSIKYESLVTAPGVALRGLFSFLEREWDPALLDRVFTQSHDPGPGDVKVRFSKSIHARSIGISAGIPIKGIDGRLLQSMNNLLAELEYPVVGVDWADVAAAGLGVGLAQEKITNNQTVSNIDELFMTHFPRRLQTHAGKAQELGDVIVKFMVHGGGVWLIDLTQGGGQIMRGDGEANLTIEVSADDLLDIVNGKLDPVNVFSRGKVKITGYIWRAIEVGQILF
jgi:protein-tyrosine sulfotransferase